MHSSSSSEIINSMQSIHLSSQHPSPVLPQSSMPFTQSSMSQVQYTTPSTQQSVKYTPSRMSDNPPTTPRIIPLPVSKSSEKQLLQPSRSSSLTPCSHKPESNQTNIPKSQPQTKLNASIIFNLPV